jgi:hypothetical protein
MVVSPIFITLGPSGTCHENALHRYLEFQGLRDAEVRLVGDLLQGFGQVRNGETSFWCSAAPIRRSQVVTERCRQEAYVVDTFCIPPRKSARKWVCSSCATDELKTLGVVPAAVGYTDPGRWVQITEESANPIVARKTGGMWGMMGKRRRGCS